MENSLHSIIHKIAHKFDYIKSVSHTPDKLSNKMSNLWCFFITNNADTSNLDEASEIVDVVMAHHSRANEIFYGFRCYNEEFTIEVFADFGVEMSKDMLRITSLGLK